MMMRRTSRRGSTRVSAMRPSSSGLSTSIGMAPNCAAVCKHILADVQAEYVIHAHLLLEPSHGVDAQQPGSLNHCAVVGPESRQSGHMSREFTTVASAQFAGEATRDGRPPGSCTTWVPRRSSASLDVRRVSAVEPSAVVHATVAVLHEANALLRQLVQRALGTDSRRSPPRRT
ncbi:unnamed protein product [Prorocentrum cordatum]|uniref:Uncharacterized protein n=1 Tax=Prorocentrum cordatum TaxID=2364126 RepID=A0ABN9YEA6_9DINO|nr:unnamed protein product [Polarella glacialis]